MRLHTPGRIPALIVILVSWMAASLNVLAQPPQPPAEGTVQMNLPVEVEIEALVNYISERLGIKVLYDDSIKDKLISIRAPGEIPINSLLSVLRSALRIKGLILAETGTPGWYRIAPSEQLLPLAEESKIPLSETFGDQAVTEVFVLKNLSPTRVDTFIKPFLTAQGPQTANSIPVEEQSMLIVTDYASNLRRISRLIEVIDVATTGIQTEFIKLNHTSATEVAQQVTAYLDAKTAQGTLESAPPEAGSPSMSAVVADSRTNQLIVVGRADDVARIKEFVSRLDVALEQRTEVYSPRSIPAERLEALIQGLHGSDAAEQSYQLVVMPENNVLVITAPEKVHHQVQDLLKRFDAADTTEMQQRMKFYRLKYLTATEALETLRGIQGTGMSSAAPQSGARLDGRYRIYEGEQISGPNRPQLQPTRGLPTPPNVLPQPPLGSGTPLLPETTTSPSAIPSASMFPTDGVRVTADIPSNTLIIIADPVTQDLYGRLIEMLDRPRPQVLIEAKVVVLDTTDNFSFGVEVSGGDRLGDKKLFAFNSFGLSEVNPVNGALSIIPGIGFNGTLVDPDVADVVLRAFTRHRRAKVISAPRVLVNDNAEGILTSVTEVPFTSVNASQTVATTSFAGFAEAGTTITVTPHISEDDQLQLDYQITLNEF